MNDSLFDRIEKKTNVDKDTLLALAHKLQTGNGSEIFLVSYHETEYPFYIEKMLHQKFYKDRKKGEWFELEEDAVFTFKNECKRLEDLIEAMKDNPFFKKNLK